MPVLNNCCRCLSLRVGSLISGTLGILIGLGTLLLVVLTKIKMKTILIDSLPQDIVRIIIAINLAMTIFISVLLIVGVIRRNRWLMLPWVVLAIMIAIGLIISIIYTSVVLFINKDVLLGVLWLIIGLLLDALFIYLWVVVFSFYQLITEEKNRGPYGQPYYYNKADVSRGII